MNPEHQSYSQLFTIRVWQEEEADGQRHWRGKLCHVTSGESRYFRGWAALIPLILNLLRHYPATVASSNEPTIMATSGQPPAVDPRE